MIYLASYKANKNGILGSLSKSMDRAEFTHSEVCRGNPLLSEVECIAASAVDGGVRTKVMRLSAAKWEVLPMPWVTEVELSDWMTENVGAQHDGGSAWRAVAPWMHREHAERWSNAEAAADIAGFEQPWRLTSQSLHVLTLTLLKRYYTELYRLHQIENQAGSKP
jgi:hypothetical protein